MFGFGKSKKKTEEGNGISDNARLLMDMLNCPCTHFPKGSDPSKVLNAYDDAFAKREMGGYTPMIIAADVTLLDNENGGASSAERLKAERDRLLASPRIDAQKWFAESLAYWKNELDVNWDETVGEIVCESGGAVKSFSGFIDLLSPQKSRECVLALIPTNEPWEVFACLPFGGWNETPSPEETLWLAKYWYERYNAVPAVMTNDVLEFSAPPVKDKETALGLALEQFAACSDIVFQGVGTIGRLAGGLMQSSAWFFWWD